MVPEWLRSRNMTAPIHDAHMTLAFENDGVYFDQAPTGLEDNAVNIIHYDAEGFRTYGAQLADALPDLIADDRLVYDFRGQETGDGATRNSNELLGTYQLGSRRFTLQSGAGIGLSDRCISPSGASVLNSPSAAAIQFTPTLGSSDIAVEWKANLAGRQWITLRGGNGEGAPFGFFGYDGYLFRVDASNTVSLFNINGQTVAANLVVNAAMGVVGSTALFRASAIGTRLRFEVSNNQGTSWTTVIDVSDAVHPSGRAVYMQGGNGTTGGMIFADTFVLRKQLPVF